MLRSLVKNSAAALKSLFLVLVLFITAGIFFLHYWYPLINCSTEQSSTELNDGESVLERRGLYEHVIAAKFRESIRAEKVAGNVSGERDGAEQLLIHPPSQPEKSEEHLDSSSPPSSSSDQHTVTDLPRLVNHLYSSSPPSSLSSDQILRQTVTDPPQQVTVSHLYSSSPPSRILQQTVTNPPQQVTVSHLYSSSPPSTSDQILRQTVTNPPQVTVSHLYSSSPPSRILRQTVTNPPQQVTVSHLYSSSPPSSSSNHFNFKPNFRQTLVTRPSQHITVNQPGKRTGFILATYFWDQQTYSVGSILALQRWAAWLGVHTVEPFLVNTKFSVPFDDYASFHRNGSVSHMKMGTMYDIDDWNNKSAKLQFKTTPLMTWDYFLKHACREVIYVEMMQESAVCHRKKTYVPVATSKTLSLLGFNVIKTQCVSLPKSPSVQLKDFKAKLYGNFYLPNNVTLILSEWSHHTIRRVEEGKNRIIAGNVQLLPLRPSKSILREAEEYKVKFLPPQGRYMSILLRTEWFYYYKTSAILSTCLQKAINWMRGAMILHRLSNVFVGIDLGKYGSTTMEPKYRMQALELGENFLKTAYRDQNMTLRELEKTFEVIESQSKDPGYVAFLQKTVAVAGKCLLLIGGGSFHEHALRSYQEHHKEHCYLLTDHKCVVKKVNGMKV